MLWFQYFYCILVLRGPLPGLLVFLYYFLLLSLNKAITYLLTYLLMSKDNYPSLFSRQMEAIVFIVLEILIGTRAVLKIGEYSRIFPSFSWRIFGHVTRLDQSRASESISWIIRRFSINIPWSIANP